MININNKIWDKLRLKDIEKYLDTIDDDETFFIEFKEENIRNTQLTKEISAFANSFGGYILLGVNDSKKIVGCSNIWTELKINTIICNGISPTPHFDIKKFDLKNSKKFCPHFHLSLQSACNKTLKSMNRFYKVEDYLAQIDKINETFDTPFLGSDIITGFAGETEEDFQITVENLQKSGLSQIHVFPYSVREGTIGAKAPNQVDEKVRQLRADIVKALSFIKHTEFINKNIGKTREVLIEKRFDKRTGLLKGVTRNYLTILINSQDESLLNTLQQVKITKYENGRIFGELV